jgi:hypothetical protein
MDLRAAAYVVFGRIHVAAGMQAHVHAAHDLARAAGRVVLLEHLHLELHVLRESRGRAHGEVLRIKLQADVDDLSKLNGHRTAPRIAARYLRTASGFALAYPLCPDGSKFLHPCQKVTRIWSGGGRLALGAKRT